MQTFNNGLTQGCNFVLSPLDRISPFWGIFVCSILTSVLVLIVYRWVSSPNKIKHAKNQIKANILAIRLYKDFWRVILGSFFKSLLQTGRYFGLNLGPLLVISPLLILLFVQMDIRYGMRPFQPGEEIVLKMAFNEKLENLDIELNDSKNAKTVMAPVFIRALKEVNWKLKAVRDGDSNFEIRINQDIVSKNLVIGDKCISLSNQRLGKIRWGRLVSMINPLKFEDFIKAWGLFFDHFIYPVEKLLKDKKYLSHVSIRYPARTINFLGLHTHWLVYYLLLTLVIVLALRKRFKVEF